MQKETVSFEGKVEQKVEKLHLRRIVNMQKYNFVKITIFRQFLIRYSSGYIYQKNCNGDKKIVKATKNYCYCNKHESSLYRNKARLSGSQIFVTMTKSFFWRE